MNFYYYSVCHVCKKTVPTLLKCSKCKVLHYCSEEHKRQDWETHKDLCKVITETNIVLKFSHQNSTEFNKFKMLTAVMWHHRLKRDLSLSEQEMWMFPKVCAVCYKPAVDIVCNGCLSVAYCSVQHQQRHEEEHQRFCPNLKQCLEIHQKMHAEELGWDRVNFDFEKETIELPKNISEVVKMMRFKNNVDYAKNDLDLILMSDFFSGVINLIYSLEISKFLDKRIGKKSNLVIHTTTTEFCDCITWVVFMEFLSHWIHNLESVKIFVISSSLEESHQLNFTLDCDDCIKKRFNSSVTFLNGNYQDHIGQIPRPDVLVMFDSFIPEKGTNEWVATMPQLLSYENVPIVLTSYTREELDKSVKKFPPAWIKYYVTPRENTYGSLRPVRNSEEGCDPVIKRNAFLAVIAKKEVVCQI